MRHGERYQNQSERASAPQADNGGSSPFITRDPATLELLEEARRAAQLAAPVLIRGETGVGKELVAGMVHRHSGRHREPFVAVNAAALPRELFDDSLFGHVKGAFTGATSRRPGLLEAAGGGTIFLDEIAELEWGLQAKILRMLDSGEYTPVGGTKRRISPARIIAATNRDLESLCRKGLFRRDLFYRLAVLVFEIPPLRRRRCDIDPITRHILSKIAGHRDTGPAQLTGEALALLESYSWPGNVRELEGELLRAMLKVRGGPIRARHLSQRLRSKEAAEEGKGYDIERLSCRTASVGLDSRVEELMRAEIERALSASGGNKAEAARMLEIKRTTLLYRMRRFGVDPPES